MDIRDLKFTPISLGKTLLVDVKPGYVYKDGKKTDECTHYVYTVVLSEHSFDKIKVKIDGNQLMETPVNYVEVELENLEIYVYMQNNQPIVAGKATNIKPISKKP